MSESSFSGRPAVGRVWRLNVAAFVAASMLALALLLSPPPTSASHSLAFLITPVGFDFGEVAVGETSPPQSVQVTNVSNEPQTLNLAGGAAGVFGGTQNCQGNTLAPGASCQITYQFTPLAPGVADRSTSGTVNGQSFSIEFRGTGIATAGDATRLFLITPVAFDFGETVVGGTAPPQSVQVTNVSGSSQTLSLAGGAAGVFGGFQNCQGNTLAPGESCQVTYQFRPTELGAADRSTTLSVNGQNASFNFLGAGVTPHPLVIETAALPDGTVGEPYSAILEASGGVEPHTWSISVLPGGLILDPDTGEIIGTPLTATSLTIQVQVTDNAGTMASTQLILTIAEADEEEEEPGDGQLVGDIPSSGFGLVTFGGTIEQLAMAMAGAGCDRTWATSGGSFIIYIPTSAVAAVNAPFLALWPGSSIPPATPLLIGNC